MSFILAPSAIIEFYFFIDLCFNEQKKAANIRKASLRRPHSPPVQTIASTSCSVKTKKREETSGSPFHFVAHGKYGK